MGLMGCVKQQKKTWSVASTPFRHPAKFSGERRNCGGFLGHGGLMGVSISDWGTPMTMETSIHLEPLQPERCR